MVQNLYTRRRGVGGGGVLIDNTRTKETEPTTRSCKTMDKGVGSKSIHYVGATRGPDHQEEIPN